MIQNQFIQYGHQVNGCLPIETSKPSLVVVIKHQIRAIQKLLRLVEIYAKRTPSFRIANAFGAWAGPYQRVRKDYIHICDFIWNIGKAVLISWREVVWTYGVGCAKHFCVVDWEIVRLRPNLIRFYFF